MTRTSEPGVSDARHATGPVDGALARTVTGLRQTIGSAVRSKVAGDDARAAHDRIWHTPGERWFTEADPVWRVHADASMFPAGIAALLLQSLHPSAMAGVAGHSGYRSDPWGRLQRTSHYIATTTFGTVEHAEEAIGVVRSVHERVRGKDDLGRPYRASDPHLLRWVHAAEIWSFLAAHQRYGARPLDTAQSDTYVAQAAIPAARLGATDLPQTVAELDEVIASYRPELRVTPAARSAAQFLLREPPLPVAARPGYAMLTLGAVALLPDWAREQLGLRRLPGAGVVGHAGTRLVRWGMSSLD